MERFEERALAKSAKYVAKAKLEAAAGVIQSALEKKSDSVPLLLELSRLMLFSGRREEVSNCVRRVLRVSPDTVQEVESFAVGLGNTEEDPSVYRETLAEHYLRNRELPRALEILERIRHNLTGLRSRAAPRAEKLLSERHDKPINPQLLPSVYLVALCDEISGQYAAAAKAYMAVLDRNPDEADPLVERMQAVLLRDHRNLDLRLRLARSLAELGKIEPALAQCSLALEIDPSSAAQVSSLLQHLAAEAPESIPIRSALARSQARQGQIEECLKVLQPLVVKGHDLDASLGLLEELAHRYPEHTGILVLLSEIYLKRGKGQQALAAFNRLSNPPADIAQCVYARILEHDPASVTAFQKLLQLHLREAKLDQASRLCAKAWDLDPDRALILIPELQALLEARPGDRRAHLLLARLQAHRGEHERAGILLRRLLVVDPEAAAEIQTLSASLPAPASDAPQSRHLRLVRLEAALARGDLETALAAANPVLDVEPPALPDAVPALARLLAADATSAAVLRELLERRREHAGCGEAIGFLLGECAAAEQNVPEATRLWKACVSSRAEAADAVRQALGRLRDRVESKVEIDAALLDLELDLGNYAAVAEILTEIVGQRPEAATGCLERLAKLVRQQPRNLDIRIGLCVAYAACHQHDQALALGEETLRMEDSERTAPLHLALAEVHIERGEARKAIKQLLNAITHRRALALEVVERLERMRRRDPALAVVHLALGRVLTFLERFEESLDSLTEAWRLEPGQADLVLEELQRIQSRHPAGPVLRLLLARIYTGKRDYGKATEVLSQLLDSTPEQARSVLLLVEKITEEIDLPEAHLLRGRALLSQGNVAAACGTFERVFRASADSAGRLLAFCQKALELEPTAPEPYLLACDLHRALKRPAAAVQILSAALDRGLPGRERFVKRLATLQDENRKDTSLLLKLAGEYVSAGSFDGALQALSEAASRDPMATDGALEIVGRVIAEQPKLPDGYLVRASLLGRKGSLEAALSDLGEFLRLAPSRRAEALPAAEQLRKREPRNPELLALTVDVLTQERRYDEASKLLKEGITGTADPAQKLQLYLRQWQLHMAQGKEPLARQVLENAQSLAPDPNTFLGSVHQLVLERITQCIGQVRERLQANQATTKEIETLVLSLLLLGWHDEARQVLCRHSASLDRARLARLHSAIAEGRGDYRRALDLRRAAGADRRLVYCAERCGEIEEARRLLTRLIEEGRELSLEPRLARYELDLLKRELDKDRNVLQAETSLAFGV
ncbi:MAG: tetratricopeptide repeat protein [Acidobacteriota bacterium]